VRSLVIQVAASTALSACQRTSVEAVNYRCGELAASGAKHADGQGNEFWTKGADEAMLTLAGEASRNCAAQKD
jgi:membrane-bound inhibitor of C-type lysozyme